MLEQGRQDFFLNGTEFCADLFQKIKKFPLIPDGDQRPLILFELDGISPVILGERFGCLLAHILDGLPGAK